MHSPKPFATLFTKRRTHRTKSRNSNLAYGKFEPRTMLATLTGTAGFDVYVVKIFESTIEVTKNGSETNYVIDRSIDNSLTIDALNPSEDTRGDVLRIFDHTDDDTVVMAENRVFLTTNGFEILALNFESPFIFSGGGNDKVTFENTSDVTYTDFDDQEVIVEFPRPAPGIDRQFAKVVGYSQFEANAKCPVIVTGEPCIQQGFVRWITSNGNDKIVTDGNTTRIYNDSATDPTSVFNDYGSFSISLRSGVDEFVVNIPDMTLKNNNFWIFGTDDDNVFRLNTDTDTLWTNRNDDGGATSRFEIKRDIYTPFHLDGFNEYYSGSGDDQFDIVGRPNSLVFNDTINAGAGNDVFVIGEDIVGGLDLRGGAGNDLYDVSISSLEQVSILDSINSENDRFFVRGTDQADTTVVAGNSLSMNGIAAPAFDVIGIESVQVLAGGGDDQFNIGSNTTINLTLRGQGGNDRYSVGLDSLNTVSILDSVGAEADRIMLRLTEADDTILVNESSITINGTVTPSFQASGIEIVDINARGGNDKFDINTTTNGASYLGGDGNDHFEIEESQAAMASDYMRLNGNAGKNTMTVKRRDGFGSAPVVVTDSQIRAMTNATITYRADGGSFSRVDNDVGGIELVGTEVKDAFLIFDVNDVHSLLVSGLGGREYIRVDDSMRARFKADGGEDRDRYVFEMVGDGTSRTSLVDDSGIGADNVDRVNVFLTDQNDSLTIDGEEFSLVNDQVVFGTTVETLEILGGAGEDVFTIHSAAVQNLQVKGQDDSNTFNVLGAVGIDNLVLIGGVNNDSFNLFSSNTDGYVTVLGLAGDDTIEATSLFLRDGTLNGGDGSDTYKIDLASESDRRLAIQDSGDVGNDIAEVRLNTDSGNVLVRAGGIFSGDQGVFTTHQLESTTVIGSLSSDNIWLYASPSNELSIQTNIGNDRLTVNGTVFASQLNVDLGSGNDVASIFSTNGDTETIVEGGQGNDIVNVASLPTALNGSLDQIQGSLSLNMGAGTDRIYFDDSVSGAPYGYSLSDTSLTNLSQSRPRPGFAGVEMDSVENVTLVGNQRLNLFDVEPSRVATFSINGGDPVDNLLTVGGPNDGRRVIQSDDNSGRLTFNTFKDIFFENFEI